MSSSADGRFAPSPTGELHLGNLRTALLAWLFARSQGGRFIVRIEDIDPDRGVPGMAERHLADLAMLGMEWDGEPVRQTERLQLYAEALESLRARELLYPCFCTRAEIRAAASAPNTAGHGPEGAYPGTCADLDPALAAKRIAAGDDHCLRVRGASERVTCEDRLLGPISGVVDDFVVRRKDGVPAYNLAVVVDDAAQGIGEVVRGADLADSSPRQAWLGRALALPVPRYAHVPLVLGADGTRLAKRHGSVTLADALEHGLTAAHVRSWLAWSLGLAARGEAVPLSVLLDRFDPGNLPREPTVVSDGGPQVPPVTADTR